MNLKLYNLIYYRLVNKRELKKFIPHPLVEVVRIAGCKLAYMKLESLVIVGQWCTARHAMGAGHAWNRYLNYKGEDAKGRATIWSAAVIK